MDAKFKEASGGILACINSWYFQKFDHRCLNWNSDGTGNSLSMTKFLELGNSWVSEYPWGVQRIIKQYQSETEEFQV